MKYIELQKRIKVSFPEDQLNEIVYHASYTPQDPELVKRNKNYIQWGHSIILAAYALYLYQNEKNLNEANLSNRLNHAHYHFENMIYEKFQLEEFVLKCNAEPSHPDIASKLIVLMYQNYGFGRVYEFLSPFFLNQKEQIYVDYKTIIQKFAQERKLFPLYEITNTSGPDHEKCYTCKLTVGKMVAMGDAIGKKNAEKEAAKQFSLKYSLTLAKTTNKSNNSSQPQPINPSRCKEIDSVIRCLHLDMRYLTLRQMNEVLVHRSYSNIHPDQNSNAKISIVGANFLSMLAIEYILDNYDTSTTSVGRERAVLLQEDNLAKHISNSVVNYILKTRKEENEKTIIRLKIDVIKSVIGMLCLNYIRQARDDIWSYLKIYSFSVLSESKKEKILDFRTFLQEIVQTFNWTYKDSCELQTQNVDMSTVFVSVITVEDLDWKEEGIGAGGSKVAATNMAAKDIIAKLVQHCDDNNTIKAAILRMLDPELLFLYESKKNLSSLGHIETTPVPETSWIIKKHCQERVLCEKSSEVSFDDSDHVLYVCKGTISCRKKGHEIVPATGILTTLSGRQIKININCCVSCAVYFISLSEYKYYQNLYGALLGNISIQRDSDYSGSGYVGYDSLADESILHMHGYTVNQAEGLSAEYRRKILANLMDFEIVSKYRIIEYLQFFINSSKYKYNMRFANKKWSEDLSWVRDYKIDKQREYFVTSVRSWR